MSSAAAWIDLEILILSEVIQTKRAQCDITHMWNLNYDPSEPISKTEPYS